MKNAENLCNSRQIAVFPPFRILVFVVSELVFKQWRVYYAVKQDKEEVAA